MRLDAGKNNATVRIVIYDLTTKPAKSRTISIYPNGSTPTADEVESKIRSALTG